jgi:hypothetical protein
LDLRLELVSLILKCFVREFLELVLISLPLLCRLQSLLDGRYFISVLIKLPVDLHQVGLKAAFKLLVEASLEMLQLGDLAIDVSQEGTEDLNLLEGVLALPAAQLGNGSPELVAQSVLGQLEGVKVILRVEDDFGDLLLNELSHAVEVALLEL